MRDTTATTRILTALRGRAGSHAYAQLSKMLGNKHFLATRFFLVDRDWLVTYLRHSFDPIKIHIGWRLRTDPVILSIAKNSFRQQTNWIDSDDHAEHMTMPPWRLATNWRRSPGAFRIFSLFFTSACREALNTNISKSARSRHTKFFSPSPMATNGALHCHGFVYLSLLFVSILDSFFLCPVPWLRSERTRNSGYIRYQRVP